MPYEISTTREFAAAHQLLLYDGTLEPLHGHNWRVTVRVGASALDSIGVVMDFHELDRQMESILAPWHNRHLNDTSAFAALNPSTEHVAGTIGLLLKLPEGVGVVSVEVWETSTNSAVWRP